jgi:hypothetical protein
MLWFPDDLDDGLPLPEAGSAVVPISNRPVAAWRYNSRKSLELFGKNGAPEEIRTPNLLIRSQMLYPVELRARRGLL